MIFEARKNVKKNLKLERKSKRRQKKIALDTEINESPIPTPHKAMW